MAPGFRFHLVLHIPPSERIHPISLEKELIPPPLSHLCRIRPIDTENKLMFARAEEGGKWAKWVKVSGRYQLLVMGGISHGSIYSQLYCNSVVQLQMVAPITMLYTRN